MFQTFEIKIVSCILWITMTSLTVQVLWQFIKNNMLKYQTLHFN